MVGPRTERRRRPWKTVVLSVKTASWQCSKNGSQRRMARSTVHSLEATPLSWWRGEGALRRWAAKRPDGAPSFMMRDIPFHLGSKSFHQRRSSRTSAVMGMGCRPDGLLRFAVASYKRPRKLRTTGGDFGAEGQVAGH